MNSNTGIGLTCVPPPPRTPGEWAQVISAVWGQLFPDRQIGHESDFFRLAGQGSGGLFSLRFRKRMELELGRTLPIWPLLNSPTLQQLAESLSGLDPSAPWPRMFRLRQGRDEGQKLFFLPPQDGNASWYIQLARALPPEVDIWGLEMPGLNRREEPCGTLENLASVYVREILRIQETGPYRLAGYSFGGLGAFETARQLAEMGKDVSFVGIIDRTRPRCGKRVLGGLICPGEALTPGLPFRESLKERWDWTTRQIKLPLRLHQARRLWARKMESRDGLRIQKALAITMMAFYSPRSLYQGPLCLLRQPLNEKSAAWDLEATYGWKDFTEGTIETDTISGPHGEVLDGKNIPGLSRKFYRMLARSGKPAQPPGQETDFS